MSQQLSGNLKGLAPSELRQLNKLYHRKLPKDELITLDLARELYELSNRLRRRIGLLITREGKIAEVFVGNKNILYLPDLGRYRLGEARLRRLRLVFADLSENSDEPQIPSDIYTDLEKLRLDTVVAVKVRKNTAAVRFASLSSSRSADNRYIASEFHPDLARLDLNYSDYIDNVEEDLSNQQAVSGVVPRGGAVLVGVYSKKEKDAEGSIEELKELARTAGVPVLGTIIQRKEPDPKTLLGKGKLEEVVLECLRLGAEMLVFDTELKPNQWRIITNSTELKVLDRSMLILDIFAQRASSSEGRLQVELAQLKYNLPKLVEKDAGLSRLSGGIGGRGPGETKLEIGRRRIRDRIIDLEKRIDKVGSQRELRRKRRQDNALPLVCILGYTNVGKSTLFNALTASQVIAENKLFATLEPAQRRINLHRSGQDLPVIISDTVGFIRNLPKELQAAFRATLEELYQARLFIHVLDISDPRIAERKAAVDGVLEELELTSIQTLIVLNKADKVSEEFALALSREYNAIAISAVKGQGIDDIKKVLFSILKDRS